MPDVTDGCRACAAGGTCTVCDDGYVLKTAECLDVSRSGHCTAAQDSTSTACAFWHRPKAAATAARHAVWWATVIAVLIGIVLFAILFAFIVFAVNWGMKKRRQHERGKTTLSLRWRAWQRRVCHARRRDCRQHAAGCTQPEAPCRCKGKRAPLRRERIKGEAEEQRLCKRCERRRRRTMRSRMSLSLRKGDACFDVNGKLKDFWSNRSDNLLTTN